MNIEAKELSKIYDTGEGQITALNRASLKIEQGDFLSIMGPSGSGKSTLLHLLSGLDRPSSGRLFYDGKDIYSLGDRELSAFRRRRIGFVFQQFHLLPVLMAKPEVIFADEPTGNLDSKSGGEVMEMLKSVNEQMGKTLVVITHDERVASMAPRRFSIVDGVLKEVRG